MNLAENYGVFVGTVESVTDSKGQHYLKKACLKVRVHVIHGPTTQTPTAALTDARLSMNMYEKCFSYSKGIDPYQKSEKIFPINYPEINHDTAVSTPSISSSRLNGLRVSTNYSNQDTPVTSGYTEPQLIKKGDKVLVCCPDGDFTNIIVFDRI